MQKTARRAAGSERRQDITMRRDRRGQAFGCSYGNHWIRRRRAMPRASYAQGSISAHRSAYPAPPAFPRRTTRHSVSRGRRYSRFEPAVRAEQLLPAVPAPRFSTKSPRMPSRVEKSSARQRRRAARRSGDQHVGALELRNDSGRWIGSRHPEAERALTRTRTVDSPRRPGRHLGRDHPSQRLPDTATVRWRPAQHVTASQPWSAKSKHVLEHHPPPSTRRAVSFRPSSPVAVGHEL